MDLHRKASARAFTLVEVLVVIAIIAVLAGLILSAMAGIVQTRNKTVSTNGLQQFCAGFGMYLREHDNQLPLDSIPGSAAPPDWNAAAASSASEIWYNAIPRLSSKRGVGDYVARPSDFYAKDSMFYCPAAVLPADKLTKAYFPFAMNSKLCPTEPIRMTAIERPERTVLFEEEGLPGESIFNPNQPAYTGQSNAYAPGFVARYASKKSGLIAFCDGHVEGVDGNGIVSKGGNAISPQDQGLVYWTPDPATDPNQ